MDIIGNTFVVSAIYKIKSFFMVMLLWLIHMVSTVLHCFVLHVFVLMFHLF